MPAWRRASGGTDSNEMLSVAVVRGLQDLRYSMNRNLEHGFEMIGAGRLYTGMDDAVPTFMSSVSSL